MSSFPFSSPCLLSCSIRLSLHQKHHVVKSLCRDTALFFLWKKGAPVLWWPGGCRAACCQGSSNALSNQPGSRDRLSGFSSASTLTLQHLFPSPHKPEHSTSSKVSAKNHLARLSFSLKNELCFTFPLSCWENVKSG